MKKIISLYLSMLLLSIASISASEGTTRGSRPQITGIDALEAQYQKVRFSFEAIRAKIPHIPAGELRAFFKALDNLMTAYEQESMRIEHSTDVALRNRMAVMNAGITFMNNFHN